MSAASAIAHSAWLATCFPAWNRFQRALKTPEIIQTNILRRLLKQHAASSFGRTYCFREITSYEEFGTRVPLANYDDFAPWIMRIQQGECGVLTTDRVSHLVPTSGSSGARKLIPFTAGLQREFNAAISPWMVDMFRSQPSLIASSAYWSISPAIPNLVREPSRVPIGFEDDSQYLGGCRKRLAEATFAVPSALRLVNDNASFRYLTILSLLRHADLGLISIWHPTFLSLLLGSIEESWDELLQDIAGGTCRRASHLGQYVRDAMLARPHPERARFLGRIGPENLPTIWPRLKLVSCWGDHQATSPLHELGRRFPGIEVQPKGLIATEAFVSLPFQGLHPVAVTSHFYEFVHSSGQIYRTHELKLGERYSVVVTTGGGLWRYKLGDLVEVDCFVGQTPSIKFVGRELNVLDYCGEKLAESFVHRAITAACDAHRFAPVFAMLAPDLSTSGVRCYTLFVEGKVPVGFLASVDAELLTNPHYQLCCHLGQLGPLRGFQIFHGAHAAYIETSAAEGQRLGEIKPTALSRNENWRTVFSGNYLIKVT